MSAPTKRPVLRLREDFVKGARYTAEQAQGAGYAQAAHTVLTAAIIQLQVELGGTPPGAAAHADSN